MSRTLPWTSGMIVRLTIASDVPWLRRTRGRTEALSDAIDRGDISERQKEMLTKAATPTILRDRCQRAVTVGAPDR